MLAISKKITAIDLFCGIGGLTHGLSKGGIDVKVGIDIDPYCKYPYETNNNSKFIFGDINNLSGKDLQNIYPKLGFKMLAGCAPCQPFSSYSRSGRNKQHHNQWPLVLKFGELVSSLKPDFVTMENVPQLAEHDVFADFINSLKDYQVTWSIVDCTQFNIPQTRKRLVLLASRFKNHELCLRPSRVVPPTVLDAIGSLPKINAGDKNHDDPLHISPALSEINLKRIKASIPGGSWRDWPEQIRAECHKRPSGSTYPSVYGRMEWNKPSPTITTQSFGYGNGRFGHPEQDRAITLREAAILQTFPKDYAIIKDGQKVVFNKVGRLLGNAVPVNLGEAIANAFNEHLSRINTEQFHCS